MSRKRNIEAILIVAGLLCGAYAASACGPFFPNLALVDYSDNKLLATREMDLYVELVRLKPKKVEFRHVDRRSGKPLSQLDVELTELRAALKKLTTPAKKQARILGEYKSVRHKLGIYCKELNRWRADPVILVAAGVRDGGVEIVNPDDSVVIWPETDDSVVIWPETIVPALEEANVPKPQMPPLKVPAGLPHEFADYLRGAIEYHKDSYEGARKHWRKLLARPAGKRKFRTVWAAYMIGKSYVYSNRPEAIKWFRRVRDLARKGFEDSLGLAAESYGWEAKAELDSGHYVEAIDFYMKQFAAGDPTAPASLRTAAGMALRDDAPTRARVAGNPLARRVVTAHVISTFRWPVRRPRGLMATPELTKQWLAGVAAAKVKDMPGADRLAWAAYMVGDFQTAGQWLERAPKGSAVTLWLGAKLAFRDGSSKKGAKLLAEAVRAFAGEHASKHSDLPRTAGSELGLLLVSSKQYVEAMDVLMRHGYHDDAAYLAERVLTLDEIKKHVDRHYPAKAARYNDRGDLIYPPSSTYNPGFAAAWVRYVLARRLVREGRAKDAKDYITPLLRPRLAAYVKAMATGNDAAAAKDKRADALWEAAQITRWYGWVLLGTEGAPDWLAYYCRYERRAISSARTGQQDGKLAPPSKDERSRLKQHRVDPEKRYHYRYKAADLAWQAAELMPDNDDKTALVLCQAGIWLKAKDPNAADRFYKALVNRCGKTELGRQADQKRWFPTLKDASAPADDMK